MEIDAMRTIMVNGVSSQYKVLRIKNKVKVIKYCYLLHHVILKEVSNAKYLGVTMNTRLSWKKHVHGICGKANRTRQFLQRNLLACKPETKLQCYKPFTRPGFDNYHKITIRDHVNVPKFWHT